MQATLALSLLLVLMAVAVTLVTWSMHVEGERTRGLEAAAKSLGWSWAESQPLDVIPGVERFGLFSQGRSRSISNFMAGQKDDVRAAVFDYRFTVGGGKSQSTVRQTVVYLRSGELSLPAFSVRPEHVFHRIGSALGYQDIDFPDRPEFSQRCLLRGPDEAAVRAAFPAEVTAFFQAHPGWCADGEGDELFLWRSGKRMAPAEVPGALADATELLGRLRAGGHARA